jgi:hypothetical protein
MATSREQTPTAPADRQLVTELAGSVVARLAPEELPVLPMVAADYFADPAGTLRPRDRDQPLGFGMDLALLAPYALAVATPVVQFLTSLATDIVKDQAKDAAKPVVHDLVRRMCRRGPESIALTPAQARWVHDTSVRNALALGLPHEQARLLADALVTSVHSGP